MELLKYKNSKKGKEEKELLSLLFFNLNFVSSILKKHGFELFIVSLNAQCITCHSGSNRLDATT